MLRDRAQREDGVALVYVLFASMIISGLVAIFLARTVFESRSTARARNFESAIHVSEAGAEALFGPINEEGEDYASKEITVGAVPGSPSPTAPADHVYAPPGGLTDAQLQAWEEDWAVDLAEADWEYAKANGTYDGRVITTDGGQAFGIRPRDSADSQAYDFVFGVGFVPGIEAPNRQVRVVKMRIARRYFTPENAVLSGGGLTLGGNAEILAPGCDPATPDTCNADVHANGNVTITGGGVGSHEVQGDFTASGTFTGSAITTGGSSAGGEQTQPVPPLRARDFYNRSATYNVDPGGQSVAWYDLCPDGVIRAPGATPCTGTQIWPAAGDTSTSFRGWRFSSGTWEAKKVEAGIFYVYRADAAVNGSAGTTQRAVTILVESDDTSAATAAASGSLELEGNPWLGSALPDILFVADRDIKMKGTTAGGAENCDPDPGPCDTQGYAGFIFAREQIDVAGTVELSGAMIAEDAEDLHGLVQRSDPSMDGAGMGINGTMVLNFDDNLKLDLRGKITVEYWNEL